MSNCSNPILNDARRLQVYFEGINGIVDKLITEVQGLVNSIQSKSCDDTKRIFQMKDNNRRIAMVRALQCENKRLKDLENTNQIYRKNLKDDQKALEDLMKKYRKHVPRLDSLSQINREQYSPFDEILEQVAQWQAALLDNMRQVAMKATFMDEDTNNEECSSNSNQKLINELRMENEMIRKLLHLDEETELE